MPVSRIMPTILVAAAVVGAISLQAGVQEVDRRDPYNGSELKGEIFLCRSDQLAAGGFWREAIGSQPRQGTMSGRESTVTTWRITLNGRSADVLRYSGATQTLEAPERYTVEERGTGLILIFTSRLVGDSLQTITIDRANSSFVYSTQHVNPLWNRVNVFFGTCQPYV